MATNASVQTVRTMNEDGDGRFIRREMGHGCNEELRNWGIECLHRSLNDCLCIQ